jgi:hypothetical protein
MRHENRGRDRADAAGNRRNRADNRLRLFKIHVAAELPLRVYVDAHVHDNLSGREILLRDRARLTCGGQPVAGAEVVFRFLPCWGAGEEDWPPAPERAPLTVRAVTGPDGCAGAGAEAYRRTGDIHFAYTVQATYTPAAGADYLPCESPAMSVTALRPYRRRRYPYDAYFAEGVLYLSPGVLRRFPNAIELIAPLAGADSDLLPPGRLPEDMVCMLLQNHVLGQAPDGLRWKRSVHAPFPLAGVLPMADGDWYI